MTTKRTDGMPNGADVEAMEMAGLEEVRELGDSQQVRRRRAQPEGGDGVVTRNEQSRAVGEAHTAVDTPAEYGRLSDAIEAVGDDPRAVTDWVAKR